MSQWDAPWLKISGRVSAITPTGFAVTGMSRFARLGDCVSVETERGLVQGQIIRIERDHLLAKPFVSWADYHLGSKVWYGGRMTIAPSMEWKGRAVNALGEPADVGGQLALGTPVDPIAAKPPVPLKRKQIETPVTTGITAIDLFTPICFGQRIGVFAGAGVGKSTLLMQLATSSGFDQVVVCLVGERGREVKLFHESTQLGSGKQLTSVIATGDESPMMRRLAPYTATTIAEYYRDRGDAVLLIVDSLTRTAHAAREVALSAGEPPVARGYPPSVLADLPQLLERVSAGENQAGSITAIYSVLVDGDDHTEPVADCLRGTLDGHLNLSRTIAERGRFPAIDLLSSVSRLASAALNDEQTKLVSLARALIARYEDSFELRAMGAYQPGADPQLDRAINIVPRIYDLLTSDGDENTDSDPFSALEALLSEASG